MRENLLSGLIIALIAILAFSDRPWMASNRPVVAKIADVAIPREKLPDPESLIDEAGVHVPWMRSKAMMLVDMFRAPRPGSYDNQTKPALGYSVREITFLGMPMAYYKEWGHVLYTESDWGVVAMPLSDEGIDLLNRTAGHDVRQDGMFPFWNHVWGWLVVLGFALWGFLQWRHLENKRIAEGII